MAKKMLQAKQGETVKTEEAKHIYADEEQDDWAEPEISEDPYPLETFGDLVAKSLKFTETIVDINNKEFTEEVKAARQKG